jgi:hypothetical protein
MIINGRSMRIGDEIEGVKIVDVSADEVTVEKSGSKHTLRIQ